MEHEVQQLSKEFDRSKSKLQQSTDKNSLFEFFLAQAKERDTKARLEKLAASKFGKRRSRSSSMNRSRNNVLAEQSSTLTKSIDLPSSYSTNISTSGLRRSRSNVDVKKIISKVELRDLQARAEAKLQRVQRRDSTSSQPSQQTLKSRKELEPDSTTLSRHTKLNNSFSSLPDQPLVFDTRQTSPSKSTSSSHHRKFSSFLNNSRVTRPAGMYYLVKCLPEDNKREINQSSLRRTHSARSSTWTGCEIRYLEHSLLNTNPEMFEASKQNKGLHIQDENNNYNVDYLNTCEAPRSIKTTEHLQRNKSTSQTSLDTNSTAQDISNRNEEKSIDVSFDVKSCDEPLTERSNNFNFDLLPLPPPEFFQNEDEELETIQNHLNDVETSSNECKDNDRMRWQNEQKIKKERAEARAKQEVKRREQRQSQKMQREDKRRKEIETQSGHNCRSEQITAQTEKEDQEKKWNDNYNDLLREEEEQRRKLEELRKIRREEENQLEELLAKREAEENKQKLNVFHRKKKKKISEQVKEQSCKKGLERLHSEKEINLSLKKHIRDPSRMSFKDRQLLFQGGANSPIARIKSRKLLEIEKSLQNKL